MNVRPHTRGCQKLGFTLFVGMLASGCTPSGTTPASVGQKSDCDGRQAIPCAELTYVAVDGGGKICVNVAGVVSGCAGGDGTVKKVQDLPELAQMYMLQAANWCRSYNACAITSQEYASQLQSLSKEVMEVMRLQSGLLNSDATTRQKALADYRARSAMAGLLPVGTIIAFPANVGPGLTPDGWLVCNGDTVDAEKYPALYATLASTYNRGSEGPGQFRIPDYRGYFLRGLDTSGAVDRDKQRVVGSVQTDSVGPHKHGVPLSGGCDPNNPNHKCVRGRSDIAPHPSIHDVESGDATPVTGETRPKNLAVNWLIKY